MQSLILPYPPSINGYYTPIRGRYVISKKGRSYRTQIIKLCLLNKIKQYSKDVFLKIYFYPPDKRVRDIDNILKPMIDALKHGGVFSDDRIINNLTVKRGELDLKNQVVLFMGEKWTSRNYIAD